MNSSYDTPISSSGTFVDTMTLTDYCISVVEIQDVRRYSKISNEVDEYLTTIVEIIKGYVYEGVPSMTLLIQSMS